MKLRVIALGAALVGACDLDPSNNALRDVPLTDGALADTARDAIGRDVHGDTSDPRDADTLDGPALDGPALDGPVLDGPALDGPALDGSADGGLPQRFDGSLPEEWDPRCGRMALNTIVRQWWVSTAVATGDAPTCAGLSPAGPVRWRPFRVPAGWSAVLRVRPDGVGVRPSVRVVVDCGGACVPVRSSRDPDGTLRVWWANGDAVPHDYQIAVGDEAPGVRSQFWVWADVAPTSAHGTCATASVDLRLYGRERGEVGDEPATCIARRAPTVWHSYAVPHGGRLVATAASMSFSTDESLLQRADLSLMATCGGSCIATAQRSMDWLNEGDPTRVYLGLTQPDPYNEGYGLRASTEVRPMPSHGECRDAIDLLPTVTGTAVGGRPTATTVWSASAPPACAAASNARALYYRATVGPGETLALAGPREEGQQRLAVLDGCGGSCLGTSTVDSTTAEARWTNTGTTPREVIVASTGVPRANVWTEQFGATRGTPPSHQVCASAMRVHDGDTFRGEPLLLSATPAPCGATSETGALFYAVRVGAGQMLTVRGAARFRLLDGCDTARCLDLDGAPWSDGAALWTNLSTEAREVIVAMSLPRAVQDRAVDVRFTVGRPTYAVSTFAAACEDMSDGTPEGVTFYIERASSYFRPLPFEFPYFGVPMRGWCRAEFAGLWLDTTVRTGFQALYVPGAPRIPAAFYSNFIAPLHDPAMWTWLSDYRWHTVSGSPAHITFETTGRGGDFLNHQVRLYANGVIEFHYCAEARTTPFDVSRVQVGLQPTELADTVLWQPGGVPGVPRVGLGLRFTPR